MPPLVEIAIVVDESAILARPDFDWCATCATTQRVGGGKPSEGFLRVLEAVWALEGEQGVRLGSNVILFRHLTDLHRMFLRRPDCAMQHPSAQVRNRSHDRKQTIYPLWAGDKGG